MAIEYTWTIPTTEYEADTGLIKTVHWRCNASEGEYVASSYGTVSFGPPPKGRDVTPFEKLTEEQVLKWVWYSLDKDAIEAALAAKIEADKKPAVKVGTPWG